MQSYSNAYIYSSLIFLFLSLTSFLLDINLFLVDLYYLYELTLTCFLNFLIAFNFIYDSFLNTEANFYTAQFTSFNLT